MIQFPEGFSLALLFSDLFRLAAPFVGIGYLITCAYLLIKLMKTAP